MIVRGPVGDVGALVGQQGLAGIEGCRGLWGIMGCRGVRVHWGADRECRYSGASRGIGGIRGLLGVLGCQEVLRAIRGCRDVRGQFGV